MSTPADCPIVNDDTRSWHLDKRVPITLIFTLLSMFGIGVAAWVGEREARIAQDKRLIAIEQIEAARRLALLEQAARAQAERDERQDKTSAEAVLLLRTDVRQISEKLDRLIERTRHP